jgi:hypothetical protein
MIFIGKFIFIVIGAVFIIGLWKKEIEFEGWSNWSKMILLSASIGLIIGSLLFFIGNTANIINDRLFSVTFYLEKIITAISVISVFVLFITQKSVNRISFNIFKINQLIMKWRHEIGTLRFYLFLTAVVCELIILISDVSRFIYHDLFVHPSTFKIFVSVIMGSVFWGIIIAEFIRDSLKNSMMGIKLRNHFILVIIITISVGIIQIEYVIPYLSIKYYNKALEFAHCEKKYNDSLTYLNIAIDLSHGNKVAYIERGCVYWRLKDYTKAITDYTHAIDLGLDPHNAWISFYDRGFAYYYNGDYSKAIKDWNAAIYIDPKSREKLDKWIKKAGEMDTTAPNQIGNDER